MIDVGLRTLSLVLAALVVSLLVARLRGGASWLLLLVALWILRPPVLGGSIQPIFVAGTSMEPALHTGDLAFLVRQTRYRVGDVVAYHPSQSPEGMIVHRIVAGNEASGFVVQGDNRSTRDADRPRTAEIVGRTLVVLPSVGWFFAGLRVPILLGLVVALVAMWVAWDYLFEARKEEGLT